MSTPKKHHFVPKWYLKRFSDPSGFLHVLDRNNGLYRKQKPEKVMSIGNYYRQDWAPPGIDPNILEKRLGALIEPNAQKALDKLLQGGRGLTDDDTAAIVVYLEFQHIRVPRQARSAMPLAINTIFTNSPPELQAMIARGEVKITLRDSIRFLFMRCLTGQLVQWLSNMDWEVLESPDRTSFITTDSPVSFYNVAFPPPTQAGIGLAGTMVFFPLNSKYLLVLRHPEYNGSNRVSPSQRLPVPEINDGGIHITYNYQSSYEEVVACNWTMSHINCRSR